MSRAHERRVLHSEGNLAVIVLRPVVETHDRGHGMLPPRPMERRYRIHPARTQHNDVHESESEGESAAERK